MLYQNHGIESLATLQRAIADGSIKEVKGVGKGMIKTMEDYIAGQQ